MKRNVLAVLVAMLFVFGVVEMSGAAPVQWSTGSGGNGNWYEVVSADLTWHNASTAAQLASYLGVNGHLATITSSEEDSFVAGLINNSMKPWLGATDEIVEGSWQWVTGETWNYTNWMIGQPDNAPRNQYGEDYMHYFTPSQGWNDLIDVKLSSWPYNPGYIVEYENAPVPEPGTFVLLACGLGGFIFSRRKFRRQ